MKYRGFNTPDIEVLDYLESSCSSWTRNRPEEVEAACKFKIKMVELCNKYDVPLNKFGRGNLGTIRLDTRNYKIGVAQKGDKPSLQFQMTMYYGWEPVERLMVLMNVSKENIDFVSDRCIHKLLKGDYKVDTKDYIDMLVTQSLKNRLAKGNL
jgi:hypothetical protein